MPTRYNPSAISCDNAAWIPPDAIDLKLKLLTIAHAGTAGHRGSDSTRATLLENFRWTGIQRDVRDFVASCLLCIMAKSGNKIPRPLSTTLHGSKPNEVLHFDYLFLGKSIDDSKYVLALKDDISGYCWLAPTSNANGEFAAATLARWNRTFSAPSFWVSDQGPHFINEVLETMAKSHNIVHKPTVAYSPWANDDWHPPSTSSIAHNS